MPTTRVPFTSDMTAPQQNVAQVQYGMIRRTKSFKVCLLFLCLVTVIVLVTINKQPSEQVVRHPRQRLPPKPPIPAVAVEKYKLFHLDLKGAPPKMKYILEILPLARKAGANGLLIEYEDSFPWSGSLRNISAGNAYTREQVQELVVMASDLNMVVIPLVQTFGHMEFVLKLAEFRHLRELDSFPQEVCPSKDESYRLIKEMIRQIMDLHPGARYLHIGCDEVYHIAACSTCARRNARTVFISHVKKIGEHIRETYPGVTPIIWDDMMRRWSPIDIEESGLGEVVEPMIWVYIDDIPRLVPHFIWFVYKKTFRQVWGASAFKGAFGEKEVLPDLPRHVENNLAWLRLMTPQDTENTVMHKADFRGIVLTGWSRYDHFAVLAELFPLAIPSLILNLALTDAYGKGLNKQEAEDAAFSSMIDILRCPEPFPFHNHQQMKSEKFQWVFGRCSYPGSKLYQHIYEYFSLKARLSIVVSQRASNGWVSDYNRRHNYSSPYRVLELFTDEGFAAQRLHRAVAEFKIEVSNSLQEFYDKYTVTEWIEQKVEPMERTLKEMETYFQTLVELKTWPRRPLVPAVN